VKLAYFNLTKYRSIFSINVASTLVVIYKVLILLDKYANKKQPV